MQNGELAQDDTATQSVSDILWISTKIRPWFNYHISLYFYNLLWFLIGRSMCCLLCIRYICPRDELIQVIVPEDLGGGGSKQKKTSLSHCLNDKNITEIRENWFIMRSRGNGISPPFWIRYPHPSPQVCSYTYDIIILFMNTLVMKQFH